MRAQDPPAIRPLKRISLLRGTGILLPGDLKTKDAYLLLDSGLCQGPLPAWTGPHGERKAKEEANQEARPPSPFSSFQNASAGSGAKEKGPPKGGLHPGPRLWGRWQSTEQAFSPAVPSDRSRPACQVPHGQEAQSLCPMPAGKQEAFPFVAVAGLTSLRMDWSGHWLLSFL